MSAGLQLIAAILVVFAFYAAVTDERDRGAIQFHFVRAVQQ